jgi:hypothetical protein
MMTKILIMFMTTHHRQTHLDMYEGSLFNDAVPTVHITQHPMVLDGVTWRVWGGGEVG